LRTFRCAHWAVHPRAVRTGWPGERKLEMISDFVQGRGAMIAGGSPINDNGGAT
jgi:hypothetical protein